MAKQTQDQGKEAKKNKEQALKAAQQIPAPKLAKPEKSQKAAAKSAKQGPKKESIFSRIAAYFKNVRLEIKRTTWPTKNEVGRMSLIVVGALLFFGVFIFVIDWAMTFLVETYSQLRPEAAVDPSAIPTDTTGVDTSTPIDNAATNAGDASTDATNGSTANSTGTEGTE